MAATDQSQVPSNARRWIFFYDLVMIAILVLLAVLYFIATDGPCTTGEFNNEICTDDPLFNTNRISSKVQDIIAYSIWFGALGGLVISLKGVYDHGRADWQERFNLWHVGRPVSGAIVGGMTYLLLQAVAPGETLALPVVLAAAFVLGTQERRFFSFLYEVARLVVQTPAEDRAPALNVVDIQPGTAAPGTKIRILGQGFVPGIVVELNGTQLEDVIVEADGTAITGTVPAVSGAVNVLVINPDGAARYVTGKLTIDESAASETTPDV